MKCRRCGAELPGGRGAYRWRSEVVALGEDTQYPSGLGEEAEEKGKALLAELEKMSAAEIEADVYQLWEGIFCRQCRYELGKVVGRFLNH
jgi:hypothetical protein